MDLDVLETGHNEGWIAKRFQTRAEAEQLARQLSKRAISKDTGSTFQPALLPVYGPNYNKEFAGRGAYGVYWRGRGKEKSRLLKRFR